MKTINEDKNEKKKKILLWSLVAAFLVVLIVSIVVIIGVVIIPSNVKKISLEEYYMKLEINEIASVLFFDDLTAKILYKKDENKLGRFKKGQFASAKLVFKDDDEFAKCKAKTIEVLMKSVYELDMEIKGASEH